MPEAEKGRKAGFTRDPALQQYAHNMTPHLIITLSFIRRNADTLSLFFFFFLQNSEHVLKVCCKTTYYWGL